MPLYQIKSSALLNELSNNNIHTVFCDEKYNPSFEITPFSNSSDFAGKIMDQSNWQVNRKNDVWKNIVIQKIKNQRKLLQKLNLTGSEYLKKYENTVLSGDKTNCEAQSARIYFKALFGNNFIRHSPDEINSALNYGYILLLNSFNRILSIHGYSTALGINHSNRQNSFNLSCDLMEPLRPVIDEIVYNNQLSEFDWEYKKILIESLQKRVKYGEREMKLNDACECFSLDVIKSVYDEKCEIKEICLD